MSWAAAAVTGAGLGLTYFGGLWLTTRRLARGRGGRGLATLSWAARLALATAAFYALSREGVEPLLAGLGGLWLARGYLILRLGGPGGGR
jgi:F1F0 ATPase subunit 2